MRSDSCRRMLRFRWLLLVLFGRYLIRTHRHYWARTADCGKHREIGIPGRSNDRIGHLPKILDSQSSDRISRPRRRLSIRQRAQPRAISLFDAPHPAGVQSENCLSHPSQTIRDLTKRVQKLEDAVFRKQELERRTSQPARPNIPADIRSSLQSRIRKVSYWDLVILGPRDFAALLCPPTLIISKYHELITRTQEACVLQMARHRVPPKEILRTREVAANSRDDGVALLPERAWKTKGRDIFAQIGLWRTE